jgi:hypothetical protein
MSSLINTSGGVAWSELPVCGAASSVSANAVGAPGEANKMSDHKTQPIHRGDLGFVG